MIGFFIRRVLWILPVLWLVATITFFLMHSVPGGPFDAKGERVPESLRAAFNAKYGLDKSLPAQYADYLANAVQFDWGTSYQEQDRPVSDIFRERFPVSFRLGIFAFIIALCVGVPLGVLAALRQNTWVDYVSLFVATAAYTVPSFVLAIFAITLFAVRFPILPILWEGNWKSYVLPSLILGLGAAAFLARLSRSSILEIVRQDYVRTARAKGLPSSTITLRHIVRSGLIPIVTIMGPLLAGLTTGTLVIEYVFGIPGIGRNYIDSIYSRDYPVIMATTLMYAVAVALGNLMVDLVYGVVDPRIKAG